MSAFVEMFKEARLKSKEDKIALEFLNQAVRLNNRLLLDTKKDLDLLRGVYKI
jgi:hypothetical protein